MVYLSSTVGADLFEVEADVLPDPPFPPDPFWSPPFFMPNSGILYRYLTWFLKLNFHLKYTELYFVCMFTKRIFFFAFGNTVFLQHCTNKHWILFFLGFIKTHYVILSQLHRLIVQSIKRYFRDNIMLKKQ